MEHYTTIPANALALVHYGQDHSYSTRDRFIRCRPVNGGGKAGREHIICNTGQNLPFLPHGQRGTLFEKMASCKQSAGHIRTAVTATSVVTGAVAPAKGQRSERVLPVSDSTGVDDEHKTPHCTVHLLLECENSNNSSPSSTCPNAPDEGVTQNQTVLRIAGASESKGPQPRSQNRSLFTPKCNPHRQHQHHPLGSLFCPELDKARVISVVSEILCRPGYTTGPNDERRLMNQIRNGRVDVRTMSKLLRWLRGERAEKELLKRGLRYIGPSLAVQPYTTGMGITWLLGEVARKHPAGTKFVICSSSSYDACTGTIAGVLSAPTDTINAIPTAPSSTSSKYCHAKDRRQVGCTAMVARGGYRATSMEPQENAGRRSSITPVALLFDEKPKHLCRSGPDSIRDSFDGIRSSSVSDAWRIVSSGLDAKSKSFSYLKGEVSTMPVREWVEAYGECDGPMLAAWVFRDSDAMNSKLDR